MFTSGCETLKTLLLLTKKLMMLLTNILASGFWLCSIMMCVSLVGIQLSLLKIFMFYQLYLEYDSRLFMHIVLLKMLCLDLWA